MNGFSWIRTGRLAAMPRPGNQWGEGGLVALDEDLAFLAARGTSLLVTLTVDELPPERVRAHGIEPLHLPVPDFTAPTRDQVACFLAAATEHIARGGAVAVHCASGKGRTGTFVAAYLVAVEDMDAEQAMAEVRRLRPGSIETVAQENTIRALARERGERPAG